MSLRATLRLSLLVALGACTKEQSDPPTSRPSGVYALTDFSDKAHFWAAPFPDDGRRDANGKVSFEAWGNPTGTTLVPKILAFLPQDGFSITAGVFFPMSAAIAPDAVLPTPEQSVSAAARVFIVGVTEGSPHYGKRIPILADFRVDGGMWGAPNLLSMLPYQGTPMRPRERYAAVVLRSLGGSDGRPLAPSPALWDLAAGRAPAGMTEAAVGAHRGALGALAKLGVATDAIAAVAVFQTGDPGAELARFREHALSLPTPKPNAPFEAKETFPEHCVFRTTIDVPVYQSGTPPYNEEGGGFQTDPSGVPIVQRKETASFVVTIPTSPMPPGGYPTVIFSRTGGGGDRPLVDRGPHATAHGPDTPGTGPAREFAKVGWAGVSIDGPHGGLRNVTMSDEQFLMFNVTNPVALRDNVRQSAIELSLATRIVEGLEIDASGCKGASPTARLDHGMLVLMGHSMGATISPIAAAYEPRFKGLLLSGAGGSYIHNIIDKKKPIPTKGAAELILKLAGEDYHLHPHDPLLTLFQWGAEPADPPAYGRLLVAEPPMGASPKHVLQMQGIVDHYILPSIANATSLSFGLDLGGEALDAVTPEAAMFDPIATLLPWTGHGKVAFPVKANVGGAVTAVVTQHAEDGIEDGHEVVFQTEPPKVEYRCFLKTLLVGAPVVTQGDCP